MLEDISRERLAFLPTPLHRMDNLAESLGFSSLWIKRDDLTGPGFGGNKTRKLEFVLADALESGCDTVVTVGATGSNSCRQTAEAAARLGLRCILLLGGEQPEQYEGNLLISNSMGAELKFYPDDNLFELNKRLDDVCETLRELGLAPYAVPAGASTPLGVLGYVLAMEELKEQMENWDFHAQQIILASGTGGTLAGMLVGAEATGLDVELIAVSAVDEQKPQMTRVQELVTRVRSLYPEIPSIGNPQVTIDDSFLGEGYGVLDSATRSAIQMFAKLEGIMLDPVYTGKAGLALVRNALAGEIDLKRPTLFWHTGGQPALFKYSKSLTEE
ncbi:D-cysteine desulfhydrase family protein [Candidatus Thorarchaeota archaeon]|nr:MAG: D-cysteine desulfhydrase family protein [Candidatus Thorarchaeota archaeon]